MQKTEMLARKYGDIILIMLVAVVIRGRNLLRYDLWYDEAKAALALQTQDQTNLYDILVKITATVFGVNDFSLRILPAIFGVLTVFLVYLAAKKMFGKEAGAVGALLTAVNPFLAGYSFEAGPYAFFGFSAILAFYAIISKKDLLAGIALVLLVLSFYTGVVFSAVLGVSYLIRTLKEKPVSKRPVAITNAVLVFTALYAFVRHNAVSTLLSAEWVAPASLKSIPQSLFSYFIGLQTKFPGADQLNAVNFIFDEKIWAMLLVAIFGVSSIVYIIKNIKKVSVEKNYFFYTFALFIIPQILFVAYGLATGNGIYVERYLFPSSIFFLILFGFVIRELANFEVMALLLLFYALILFRVQKPWYPVGMKELAKMEKTYNGEIVMTSPHEYVVAKYYTNNSPKLRLMNPRDPDEWFGHWPFIEDDTKPKDQINAVYISPDDYRMPSDKYKPTEIKFNLGNYGIFYKI